MLVLVKCLNLQQHLHKEDQVTADETHGKAKVTFFVKRIFCWRFTKVCVISPVQEKASLLFVYILALQIK